MGLKLKLGFNAGGGGGPIRDTRVLSLKSAFPSSPPKKKDLDNPNKRHQDCVAINAHSKTSVHKLLELVEFKLKEVISREATLLIFMVGIPNVANAGEDEACYCRPTPGVTQDIAGYKIAHQPSIYVLETPGVLVPSIPDVETELKLAFAGDKLLQQGWTSWSLLNALFWQLRVQDHG